jgi:hypothetical protein
LRGIPDGTYTVRLSTTENTYNQKLVKIK